MREIESVVVAGNIARDNIFGKEHIGGCAYNIASTLSRLGINTSILSVVDSSDFGSNALAKLATVGVDTLLVKTSLQEMPRCTVWGKENDFGSSEWTDNGTYEAMGKLSVKGLSILQDSLIHVASCPRILTEAILPLAKHISYEPGPLVYRTSDEFSTSVASYALYTFFNYSEWGAIEKSRGLKSPIEIMGDNCRAVIITNGERGSTIFTKDGGCLIVKPIKPRKIVDYTGAGDQYKAGFIASCLMGKSLEESATIASILASKNIEHAGGQLPNKIIYDIRKEFFNGI